MQDIPQQQYSADYSEDHGGRYQRRGGRGDHSFAPQEGVVELYMNVGLDDNLTREQVVDFITSNAHINPQEIYKVRLIKRRTFIHVPQEIAKAIISSLNRKRFAGQQLRVSFAMSH